MATTDNLDPQRALRVATEQLKLAMESLDKHVEALSKPTLESANIAARQANVSGLSMIGPKELMAQGVSTAETPGGGQLWVPGSLGDYGSEPPEQRLLAPTERGLRERLQERGQYEGGFFRKMLNQTTTGQPGPDGSTPPSPQGSAQERREEQEGWRSMPPNIGRGGQKPGGPVPGASQAQAEEWANEPLAVPQYQWRLDAYLKLARDAAARSSVRGETGVVGGLTPEGFMGGVAGAANYALAYAAPLELAKQKVGGAVGKAMEFGWGGLESGRELGFSPQGGALGLPSNIAGFRNPLAGFTSPAGEQGLREKWWGIEQSRFGTGISEQQAHELIGGIGQEGYSGEQQERLGEALAPSVKEGLSPGVAKNFVNAVRYGVNGLSELTHVTEGLGDVAKSTHMTMSQVAESMADYAKEAEQHGVTQMEGLRTAKGIMQGTGLPASAISSVNQSPFGLATAARTGLLPGQVGAMNATGQIENFSGTMETLEKLAEGHNKPVYDKEGRQIMGAQENKESFMRSYAGTLGISPAQLAHWNSIKGLKKPILDLTSGVQTFEDTVGKKEQGAVERNQSKIKELRGLITDRKKQEAQTHIPGVSDVAEPISEGIMGLGHAIFGGYTDEEKLKKLEHPGVSGATAEAAWKDLKTKAQEAQINPDVIKKAEKAPIGQRGKILGDALSESTASGIEEEGEPGKIEMTDFTKKFFKVVAAQAGKNGEEPGQGGKPSNTGSSNPWSSKSPAISSVLSQVAQQAKTETGARVHNAEG